MDLKGKAPKATTLEEANKIIEALWDIIQQLNEKSKTNSRNSSLPPSKDRSSKNKSNVKRTEERRKNPKKQGGQPGHQKHERVLLPLDKVNHIVPCCPDNACSCVGQMILDVEMNRRHQQYEFPIIRPIVTEYQIYSGTCNQCYRKQAGVLPAGISWSVLGPRATAMTANLSGTYRISKKNIVNIYHDIFDFKLSVGMVCKAEKTVSRAIASPVNQAKFFVRSSEQVSVNSDETGFKEKETSLLKNNDFVTAFLSEHNDVIKIYSDLFKKRKNDIFSIEPVKAVLRNYVLKNNNDLDVKIKSFSDYLSELSDNEKKKWDQYQALCVAV